MNYEWLMVDTTHCKVHPHAKRAKGGNPGDGCYKSGLNTKIHLAVDAAGMPALITDGKTADCTQAAAGRLLARMKEGWPLGLSQAVMRKPSGSIATRYAKTSASFKAAVQIRRWMVWLSAV